MRLLLLLFLSLFLVACSPQVVNDSPSSPQAATSAEGKYSYKTPDGTVTFEIKVKTPGEKYKLYDGSDKELAVLKIKDDRVKVSDATDHELYKIKKKDDGIEVEDAAGKRLYRIKQQADGDWKVSDASDKELVKIKKKDDGLEARDSSGQTIAKVKGREGHVNFKAEDGTELHRLTGLQDPSAAVWMSLDIFDAPLRAGLTVYSLEMGR